MSDTTLGMRRVNYSNEGEKKVKSDWTESMYPWQQAHGELKTRPLQYHTMGHVMLALMSHDSHMTYLPGSLELCLMLPPKHSDSSKASVSVKASTIVSLNFNHCSSLIWLVNCCCCCCVVSISSSSGMVGGALVSLMGGDCLRVRNGDNDTNSKIYFLSLTKA